MTKTPPTIITAPKGDKTIRMEVVFWTNNLADSKGEQIAKHAWAQGKVFMSTNDAHGIKRGRGTDFYDMLDLPVAIKAELVKAGVKLRSGPSSKVMLKVPKG
jgi:hypothetical protein